MDAVKRALMELVRGDDLLLEIIHSMNKDNIAEIVQAVTGKNVSDLPGFKPSAPVVKYRLGIDDIL